MAFYHYNFIKLVSDTISSSWFIFPMALEMSLTAIITIRKSSKVPFAFITFQSVIMLLTPDAISGSLWLTLSIFIGGSAMTILFIYLFETFYRENFVRKHFSTYVLQVTLIYGIMTMGVMLYQYNGMKFLISFSIILEMVVYLHGILKKEYFQSKGKIYWVADKKWTTMFLLDIFLTEFAMGATFDFQFYGTHLFINSIGLTAFSGGVLSLISQGVFNIFMFIGAITGSSWFFIMMGTEMGSLIVFKILKTRELENKIRLSLTIAAYAVYSTLLPDFFLKDPAHFAFFGWSMGIGSGGGLAPDLIIPIVLTYVISGSLSLLFGARQLCSVFCTAPMMYQGTFYDSMKSYNRTSKIGKYVSHGGERNLIYRTVSKIVYSALLVAAIISLLNSYTSLHFTLFGEDPLLFLYIILFDIAWYAIFLTMPYFGSYGCINTGYCHWGNFNRFIGKYGLFKLKVKDASQCVTCKTKDCASACPVGLTQQPGSFISGGEFKDSRCVGVGDCVEACPYENIFFYDVRNYLKEKVMKKND
jgi:polyferredoxin